MTASSTALPDDLLAPEAISEPHPLLARLREEAPVHWSEAHSAWLVTRYADVAAGLGDLRLSSDRVRPLLDALDPERRRRVGPVLELMVDWMVLTDPPAHTRLRRLAAGAFKPERIAGTEARIRELVAELLDEFVAAGHDDLIRHFAYPLPATIIAELVGAPAEDRERFRVWSEELALVAFGAGGDARFDRHERAARGLEGLLAYFDERIEQARRAPGDDMLSRLLEPDETGDQLSDLEVRAMCVLMLFAGHETTTTLISTGILLLLQHPEELARLRAEPKLIDRAVEEVLRHDGPVRTLIRTANEPLVLGGVQIEAGQRVFLVLLAANRDPRRFQDPERFDVGRRPNPHVAFGRGIHTCIGALLARIEGRAAIPAILEQLPGLELPEQELRWEESLANRALLELRVRYEGVRASG
jgi:cytochrome P450